jgi:predicted transposase/invertase (TIGR01784 family)
MRFISPKTDFAFKKIFGSEESKEILISFLNAILYDETETIQDLEIIDPYLAPKIRGIKDTYLDVKARLSDGASVIIEMQVLNVEGFEKRILYNAAKTYSTQLHQGEGYLLLNPVIALTITDFVMFKSIDSLLTRFILKEKTYLVDYPIYDIELVFVELPKFVKTMAELETIVDKWLFFIKNAGSLEAIPKNMADVSALRKAFELANQANLSEQELEDIERREIYIQDQKGAISKALKDGLKQGIEQGVEQGIEQGKLQNARKSVMQALNIRFGEIPPPLATSINQIDDPPRLELLLEKAITVESVEAFERVLDTHFR